MARVNKEFKKDYFTSSQVKEIINQQDLNLLNGASQEETQEYLRYANINTTMIYSHHIDRIKNKSSKRLARLLFE